MRPENLSPITNNDPSNLFQRCEYCGDTIPPFSKFCPCCGYKVIQTNGNQSPLTYSQNLISCPMCGSVTNGRDDICQYCGHVLSSEPTDQPTKCRHCNLTIPPQSNYCPYCGKKANHNSAVNQKYALHILPLCVVAAMIIAIVFIVKVCSNEFSLPAATNPEDDLPTNSQSETVKENSTKKPAVTTVKEQSADITKEVTSPSTTTTQMKATVTTAKIESSDKKVTTTEFEEDDFIILDNAVTELNDEPESEKSKIERKIQEYIDANYTYTQLDSISVNDDLGTDIDGDYVLLVHLTWNAKNSGKLSKEVLELYSSDMAARMYDDLPEIQELVVFWTVPYLNDGSAKISFERVTNGMRFTDTFFDKNFG